MFFNDDWISGFDKGTSATRPWLRPFFYFFWLVELVRSFQTNVGNQSLKSNMASALKKGLLTFLMNMVTWSQRLPMKRMNMCLSTLNWTNLPLRWSLAKKKDESPFFEVSKWWATHWEKAVCSSFRSIMIVQKLAFITPNLFDPWTDGLLCPKHPFVCPKISGFPRSNPMTWGWDEGTINPTPGMGLDS